MKKSLNPAHHQAHNIPERNCSFCGDPFPLMHELRRYCPSKYNILNYCKDQHKKLVAEQRLADLVNTIRLADLVKKTDEQPLEANIRILNEIMQQEREKIVSGDFLDAKGFDINYYSSRESNTDEGSPILLFGIFNITWLPSENKLLTFKIIKK